MLFDVFFWNGDQRAVQLSCRTLSVWTANAGPSVVMCSEQLWRGRGNVWARVWFCVGICLCLSVTLAIEWWTMRMRTRLCSDQKVANKELRYRSCALWLTNKSAPVMMSEQLAEGGNGVQLASIWGQNELLEGLGRCLWDQEPGLMCPKGSQGRLPQFR